MTARVSGPWPALPYTDWKDTLDTLHMEMQIVGKVRVALSPKEPAWAHAALYVTARGLTTGPVPSSRGIFEVEADLIDHQVAVRTAWGKTHVVQLAARPVAEFFAEFTRALSAVGVEVELSTMPQEVPDPIPFTDDTTHRTYDPNSANRFWRILSLIQPVFAEYRAAYRGRASPVHFFWGSMDLAITRFSGRPCDPPPNADFLIRDTYDAEQINAGWWPGNAAFPEPAFYAYSYPKAEGIEHASLQPEAVFWSPDLGEHLLRYDDVRAEASPAEPIRAFFDSFYTSASTRRAWDLGLVAKS